MFKDSRPIRGVIFPRLAQSPSSMFGHTLLRTTSMASTTLALRYAPSCLIEGSDNSIRSLEGPEGRLPLPVALVPIRETLRYRAWKTRRGIA